MLSNVLMQELPDVFPEEEDWDQDFDEEWYEEPPEPDD